MRLVAARCYSATPDDSCKKPQAVCLMINIYVKSKLQGLNNGCVAAEQLYGTNVQHRSARFDQSPPH